MEQLHNSQTPAWRNLRGRSGRLKKQASYYEGTGEEEDDGEDEIADQGHSDEEEGEEGGSSEVRGPGWCSQSSKRMQEAGDWYGLQQLVRLGALW